MVRDNGMITLRAAKQFAATLSPEQQKHKCCACKQAVCPTGAACCKGSCIMLSPELLCGDCLWYGCWFCVCKDKANPGTYSCTDMKGNRYNMAKVDGKQDKWACFSENEYVTAKGDDLKVYCYCV